MRHPLLTLAVGTMTTSLAVLALGPAAPAQAAAFDPATLCASATPIPAEVATALATITTNSVAKAKIALGSQTTMAMTGASAGTGVVAFDPSSGRARESESFASSSVVYDQGTSSSYEQLRKVDAMGAELGALKLLKQDLVWIQRPAPAASVTSDALGALVVTDAMPFFAGLTGTAAGPITGTPTFTCAVTASGPVQFVANVDIMGTGSVDTALMTFDADGALTAVDDQVKFGVGPATVTIATSSTLSYTAQTITLPDPRVTQSQWRSTMIRASFPAMESRVVKAARAKVKKLHSKAQRIAAIRAIAKQQSRAYNADLSYESIKTSVTSVANGAKVRVKNPVNGQYWYFTITVSGTRVTIKKNL